MFEPSYYCNRCNLELKPDAAGREPNLESHIRDHHFNCFQCGRAAMLHRYVQHCETFHTHNCQECKKVFSTEFDLSTHMRRAFAHRPFQYPFCFAADSEAVAAAPEAGEATATDLFPTLQAYKEHIVNAHQKNEVNDAHVCTQCHRFFQTAYKLHKHNSLKQVLKCDHCGQSFRFSKRLAEHIVTRHGEHSCYFCGDVFDTERDLYVNQKDHCHTMFQCDSCNKQFRTLVQCNKHRATHVAKIRACSRSDTPSLQRMSNTWNEF